MEFKCLDADSKGMVCCICAVNVHQKDLNTLNKVLRALETYREERLSFADVIHMILKPYEKLGSKEMLEEIAKIDSISSVFL